MKDTSREDSSIRLPLFVTQTISARLTLDKNQLSTLIPVCQASEMFRLLITIRN